MNKKCINDANMVDVIKIIICFPFYDLEFTGMQKLSLPKI